MANIQPVRVINSEPAESQGLFNRPTHQQKKPASTEMLMRLFLGLAYSM